MGEHILSWMTFFPVIGAAVIAFIPSERKEIIKTVAASAAAVPLILAGTVGIASDLNRAREIASLPDRAGGTHVWRHLWLDLTTETGPMAFRNTRRS